MNDMPNLSAAGLEAENTGATPVMVQYLQVKAAHPGSLLFYRMGDFYELFFDDAEKAANALGIALTKRGKHLGQDIPMCGVPVHAADGYLQRLIRKGFRVAVCEQLEDPAEARKRGSKSVVRRDVVRLVTPGTITEDTLLEAGANNYLAALALNRGDGQLAIAWADISSGELSVMTTAAGQLAADLARLEPREIVVSDTLLADQELGAVLVQCGAAITPVPAIRFDSISAERRIKEHYQVAALDAFGAFGRAEIASLGGLIDYIALTQVGRSPHLRQPRRESRGDFMLIDAATRANLELVRTVSGDSKGSLLGTIDKTMTAAGARLLADRLANPLAEPSVINARLDAVSFFNGGGTLRGKVRTALASAPDIERALGRLSVGRGGPRDLAAIGAGLGIAPDLAALISEASGLVPLPDEIALDCAALAAADELLGSRIMATLADDLPFLARDGGFVRPGLSPDLDEARALRDETRQIIAGLQAGYADETGIKSLKIRHNNILGYFIEVASQHAPVLQQKDLAGKYVHRQTVANAMRFVTLELAGLEQKILSAASRALALEQEIFSSLCDATLARGTHLSAVARAIAKIDVVSSLAELAARARMVRPEVDGSTAFEVTGGRHLVVEAALQAGAQSFIANDCNLSANAKRLWLLTGPNMAGKSTYLRQNALIVILAQIGSFVPADSAHIGVVDRLFSRVGAADDLARGRSTFMVEMVETAAILNQATEKSFVILDEIGRGTSTFDGLSIAWATVEHIHDVNRCRALFATHYHELTMLAERLAHLANATVMVREWQGSIVFLHEVKPGVADRSYGIHVAKLAGIPDAVIVRASDVLKLLEGDGSADKRRTLVDDLPLFRVAPSSPSIPAAIRDDPLAAMLRDINPDELTAREALSILYDLKSNLKAQR